MEIRGYRGIYACGNESLPLANEPGARRWRGSCGEEEEKGWLELSGIQRRCTRGETMTMT